MDDEATLLYWQSLQGDVESGHLTDWETPRYNHVVSMTCGAYADQRYWFPTWQQQFAEIVKASGLLLGKEPWKKDEAA